MTVKQLKTLHGSVERDSGLSARSQWDCQAAAHVEIFGLLCVSSAVDRSAVRFRIPAASFLPHSRNRPSTPPPDPQHPAANGPDSRSKPDMINSIATTAPTQFLDVGGNRFAYRRFGTPAGTPLVFTQHFMGNLDNFDPAISDALAPGREIILFDNVGVGRSTGTAPHTIAGMAADGASFIDGLGLTTVDIVGHSVGGEIAQLIALDRPDLVRRLVLVGTGPRGSDAIARQAPEVAPLFTRRDELGEDMWLPIMFSPSKESQAGGRAFVSRITARTDDRDIPVSAETIAAYRAAARGWASAPADNFGYLDGIAQPALVVNGSHDIVIPTINSYHLYQHLSDAELMLLPDSGHGAHFQYVERFVRRVIDFLDDDSVGEVLT
jgi:pimeloyl-ACP methyl ester carboxylesterase